MRTALRILREAIKAAWDDLWTTMACNILWILCVVLIIPGPPATLALFYYANRIAQGEVTDLNDFWRALRRYWWAGWRWGLVNLALIGFLIGDFYLTGDLSQSSFAQFAQGFYLAALAGWLGLQFFALPFLFEQEKPSVRQALRNGAVLIGKNPGFCLALGALIAFGFVLGMLLFMLSFAFGFVILAVAANLAVRNRLATVKQRASEG